jgi:hypothetical protein
MPLGYWVVTAALLVFGFLGAASIGLLLLVPALFLVLRGIAGRPRRDFWPPIVGIVLFFAAFWGVGYLLGPISCTTVVNIRQEIGPGEIEPTTIDNTQTSCDSPFLPRRIKGEAPPLWPIILSAIGIAIGGAWLTRLALVRKDSIMRQAIGGPDSKSLPKPHGSNQGANVLYWLVTGFFIVFGFVAIFSVGLPLLVLGLAMAAMSDIRDRPATFWPPLVGIALFFVAYILVAPLGCTVTPTPVTVETSPAVEPQISPMTCTRLLLPDYKGIREPALWPSVLTAAVTAGMGALVTRYLIGRRAKRTAETLL